MENNFRKFAEESFMDIHDEDVARIMRAIMEARTKYAHKSNNQQNLNELAKYVEDAVHKIGFRVHVDLIPTLYGEPPVVEILGPVGDPGETDHDRKKWEVEKAIARGEKFYGEKGRSA